MVWYNDYVFMHIHNNIIAVMYIEILVSQLLHADMK